MLDSGMTVVDEPDEPLALSGVPPIQAPPSSSITQGPDTHGPDEIDTASARATPSAASEPSATRTMRPDAVAAPKRLGRYVLTHRLASGGFATVYLGVVTGPGGFEKVVALKLLHEHLAQERSIADGFLDEARIAAAIHHSNVCTVHEVAEVDGQLFLAMDLVIGESFSAILRSGAQRKQPALSPELVAYVLAEAAEGLHAAHEAVGPDGEPLHIVHRDVAPSNLFLGYDGHVKLLDFGIAKATGRLQKTQTGTLKGHFAYMSPEQLLGRSDRRSDLFSLAIVGWELLTGRRLFRRKTDVETMMAVQQCIVMPPRELVDTVPEALERILLRALSPSPDDRQASCAELARELREWLVHASPQTTAASASTALHELFPQGQRERRALIASALDAAARGAAIRDVASEPGPVSHTVVRRRARRGLLVGAVGAVALLLVGGALGAWAFSSPAPVAAPDDRAQAGFVEEPPSSASEPRALAADPDPIAVPAHESEADLIARAAEPTEGSALEESPEALLGRPEAERVAQAPSPGEATQGEATRETRTTPRAEARRERRRAERPSAPAAEPTGFGFVNVSVAGGWGQVFVDGRHVGEAPLRARVEAGARVIRVLDGSGREATRRVVVEPDGSARAVFRFE